MNYIYFECFTPGISVKQMYLSVSVSVMKKTLIYMSGRLKQILKH